MADIYKTYLEKAYRFISFEGLHNTIKTNKLRFSRADQFNDPFDNSPYLMNLNWNEHKEVIDNSMRSAVKAMFEHSLSSIYICCFSKTYTSKKSHLMWAHYGKSHTQICFEIDFSKYKYLGGPSEVSYPECLVEERKLHFEDNESLGVFVCTNKNSVWNYEEEVRLLINTRITNELNEITQSNDGKNIDIPFDLKMISKVIFGYNSIEFNELKTIALFKNVGHVPKFEKMTVDPNTLSLKPVPYENRI